jgi:RNA polymerase sigma-70 factor (ECF subfamily)
VHRTTAWRRLEQARGGILQRTREALGERLGIDATELDSVIRVVHSRLDVTIEPFLRLA